MKNIDWKILTVLYEKKSITQAAEALYMTQPALTKRLKSIESEWDIEIVHRSHRGISLTDDGKYLCKKAQVMQEFLKEIEDHFSKEQESMEQFRLGVPNSYARLHLSKALGYYKSRHNGLHIQTIHNSSDVLMKLLLDGKLDAAVICGNFSYLGEQIELFSENLYLVTPRDVTMDQVPHLPYIESFLNPRVKSIVYQWWKNRYGSYPQPSNQVPYSDIAIEMVENGLGITTLFGDSWNVDFEKCQMIPLYRNEGEPISRSVYLMLAENCFESQSIMDFVSSMENYYSVNQMDEENDLSME